MNRIINSSDIFSLRYFEQYHKTNNISYNTLLSWYIFACLQQKEKFKNKYNFLRKMLWGNHNKAK